MKGMALPSVSIFGESTSMFIFWSTPLVSKNKGSPMVSINGGLSSVLIDEGSTSVLINEGSTSVSIIWDSPSVFIIWGSNSVSFICSICFEALVSRVSPNFRIFKFNKT